MPVAPVAPAAHVSANSSDWAVVAADFISERIDIAVIVLMCLMFGSLIVILRLQGRPDFDFADMFRDDNTGRPSLLRFAVMGSFAISSWIAMHDTLAGTLSDQQFWAYLITWSGAAILRVAADKWDGRLPGTTRAP